MNRPQKRAFKHPCLLGIEVLHPRNGYLLGKCTIILTVNAGYE